MQSMPPEPRQGQEMVPGQRPDAGDEAYGDFTEQQAFDPQIVAARSRSKLNRTNLLLIGLFAIGVASVYFLSLRKGPAKASARDQAVEQQVDSFISGSRAASGSGLRSEEGQRLVEAFYEDITSHQVPLEELKTNPFAFAGSGEPAGPAEETARRPTAEELAHLKRKAEVQAEFGKLALQSIMMSPRGGTAIINNNFVSEGQQLGSFKVAKINARDVLLIWEDIPYTLKIVE